MDKQIVVGIAVLFLFLLWVMSYIGSGSYLREPFEEKKQPKPLDRWLSEADKPKEAPKPDVTVGADEETEVPYEQRPINSVDDYEYNLVFTNESDRALTMEQRNKLMAQYPMDWSGYPPSSAQFQAGLRESFANATPTVPDDAKPYQNITGSTMAPPDMGKVEAEERKILMTYKPTFPPDPTAYDPEDVNDLVKKVYAAKGLVPEIKRRGDSNVYTIVSTRKVGEKVQFEDEVAAPAGGPSAAAGENTVKVPSMAADALSPDRFFEKGQTRTNKWDYTAWTPGLERMFAPNEAKSNWY